MKDPVLRMLLILSGIQTVGIWAIALVLYLHN